MSNTTEQFCIIVSRKDLAGMNILSCLLEDGFTKKEGLYHLRNMSIIELTDDTVMTDGIDKKHRADTYIFATRHQSSEGIRSLSVHVPGNWSKAMMGGQDRTLCTAAAALMKEALILLNKRAEGLGFEVTVEQTHHGPAMDKPCMFIEIGSSEEQWNDKAAGKIIADTIVDLCARRVSYKTAVFLGGGHYNREANKLMLKSDIAIGHICAKHSLEHLDEAMLKEALVKTYPCADRVILDWKGLGEHKRRIIEMLENNKINFERSKRI
jgi:D-aminoacyl-tRNA deacylase